MKKIASIVKNSENPAYRGACSGIDRLASKLGVSVVHHAPVVADSIAEQRDILHALILERPQAILLSPAHESQLDDVLEKVSDAGIPVFMFVGKTARDHYVNFVGADDYAMTLKVAATICEHIGRSGNVGIIDGNPLGANSRARAKGFRDGVSRYPNVDLIATGVGNFLKEPAYEAMNAILDENRHIDGMLIANDLMSVGAIQALQENGVDAAVGSVNGSPDGIAAIKAGHLIATAAFNALDMGCLSLEAAFRHLNGEALPKEIILPVEIVTNSNLSSWDLPYSERTLPVWDLVMEEQSL